MSLAIDFAPEVKRLLVTNLFAGNKPRTDGAKRVMALALGPLAASLELVLPL
jgi:hypothetical protein